MFDAPPPQTYYCTYRDGTVKRGLSYIKSLELFQEAFKTENPCQINLHGSHFDASPACTPNSESQK